MFNKRKYLPIIILLLIIAIASFVRFYKLLQYPIGFHGDEASLAYNAYSILKTGKDENGEFLPIHSNISKTYRPIGYTYLIIPSVYFLGLTEFSTRLPGAFLGVLTVAAIYFLSLILFKNQLSSLFAAFLLAINPWHIGLSRASAESLASLFFLISGFICVVKIVTSKHSSILHIISALILFLVSFITYPSPRVFVPIMLCSLIPLVYIYKKQKIKQIIILSIVSVGLSALLILGSKGGVTKFNDVGIFSYELPKALLIEGINEDGTVFTNTIVTRLFHNKVIDYGRLFIKEYTKYFSYDFLINGQYYPIRYQIINTGLIYVVDIMLLWIGIYYVIRQKKFSSYFILFWLFVGPLASSITWEDTPNILRSLPMLIGIILIVSQGFAYLLKQIVSNKKHVVSSCLLIAFVYCYSFISYFHQYYVHGLKHQPWYRDYGFKELISFIQSKPEYEKVFVTKATPGPYIHFLFYLKYDPEHYIETQSVRDDNYKGFDRFIFVPDECPNPSDFYDKGIIARNSINNVLFVANGTCKKQEGIEELKVIYRPDNTEVFRIWNLIDI